MQRHYASDTSSTNKSSRDEPEVVTKAEFNPSSRLVNTKFSCTIQVGYFFHLVDLLI